MRTMRPGTKLALALTRKLTQLCLAGLLAESCCTLQVWPAYLATSACPTWLAELQINLFAMRLDAANLWFIWFWSTKQKVGHAYAAAWDWDWKAENWESRAESREDFSSILHLPPAKLCDPLAKRKVKTWLWLVALIDIWAIRCRRSRKLIKFANYWSHQLQCQKFVSFL